MRITCKRISEKELDRIIEEHEGNGYELVKRGVEDLIYTQRHWAVMERKSKDER